MFAVVATQGDWDEPAILAALAHRRRYLSVVASARRFGEMRALLAEQVPARRWPRIKNPAGLDLGARTPEEIALGILAEIVQQQQPARATAARERRRPRRRRRRHRPRRPAAGERDPVCGMTVRDRGHARRGPSTQGATYYFCCGGCQQRFVGGARSVPGGAA